MGLAMELTEDAQLTWDALTLPNIHNEFQRHRFLNDKVWMTRERKKLKMVKMTSNHILNCIRMLEQSSQTNTRAYRGLVAELGKRFIYEHAG